MAELCLVASHGYPPGVLGKIFKDYQPFVANPGLTQDSRKPSIYRQSLHLTDNTFKPSFSVLDGSEFFRHDLATRRYVLNEDQDSLHFSNGIAEQLTLHEKVMRLLASGESKAERSGMDLFALLDLMERYAPAAHCPQQTVLSYPGQALFDSEIQPPLVSLSSGFSAENPILVGDLSQDVYHHDDWVSLTRSGVEIDDVFSTLSDIHSPKNSIKLKRLEMVVPYFDRRTKKSGRINVTGPSLKQSLKSSEKVDKASKKKSSSKAVSDGEFYRKNSFHACESLLSVIVGKKQDGKTVIHSLKKSGPELPQVLTQFSASIAGTGIAVLFSVICKVACSRVPFCASKLMSAGLGIGLVWLSWAVNKLRDTVVTIKKSSEGLTLREEEIVNKLDKNVKAIYFRAAAILAFAVLRLEWM